MALALFSGWNQGDFDDLVRLMRRFADGMSAATGERG
jgi:hypothetical protein